MCAARTSDIHWIRIAPPNDAAGLDQWCAGVGPPVIVSAPASGARPLVRRHGAFRRTVAIVSWNTHVGAGDIDGFVADLAAGRLTAGTVPDDYVLLLQETYRAGRDVPAAGGGEDAGRLSRRGRRTPLARAKTSSSPPAGSGFTRSTCRRCAMARRGTKIGGTRFSRRDRSRASPPSSCRWSGSVASQSARRSTWDHPPPIQSRLRVVTAHFSNFVAHHLWVLSEPARVRQARALAQILRDDQPTALGGDFNSWFGYADAAYRTMTHVLPGPRPADRRPTFTGMRLDHLMFRLPQGWHATTRRADGATGPITIRSSRSSRCGERWRPRICSRYHRSIHADAAAGVPRHRTRARPLSARGVRSPVRS